METSLHAAAKEEILDARDFYELRSTGLGAAFLDDFERTITLIQAHPEGAPKVQRRVYRKLLQRFPYALVYSVRPDEIRVLAVAHQKRRPFYWRGRH